MNKIWFKRKRYGWGWTPVTWQAWLLVLAYGALLAAYPVYQELQGKEISVPIFLAITIPLTLILIYISYRKGEKPKWSWGD